MDYLNGKTQFFDFGPDVVAGEPVFAARPGAGHDNGWLIVQCSDGRSERAFFALFDAANVDAGPIARIRLPHALPISFHGWWKAGSTLCRHSHRSSTAATPTSQAVRVQSEQP